MSQTSNMCQLCLNICDIGFCTGLYEDFEVYKVTTKYFDLATFNMEDPKTVICSDCCFLMNDFYNFQMQVIKAHENHANNENSPAKNTEAKGAKNTPKKCKEFQTGEKRHAEHQIRVKSLDKLQKSAITEDADYGYNLVSGQCSIERPWSEFIVHENEEKQVRHELQTPAILRIQEDQLENSKSNQSASLEKECEFICLSPEGANFHASVETPKDTEVIRSESEIISLSACEIPWSSSMDITEDESHIEEWRPTLKCYICQKTFRLRKIIQRHFLEEHPNEKLLFFCCGIKFTTDPVKFEEHSMLHKDANAYQCKLCKISFKWKTNLKSHSCLRREQLANENKYACIECGLVAKTMRNLRQHMITHSICSYRCPLCPKSYTSSAGLKKHMDLHFGKDDSSN